MELRQHRPLHPPQAGANYPAIDVISKKLDVRSCIVFVRTAALWNLLCYVLFLQAVLLEIFRMELDMRLSYSSRSASSPLSFKPRFFTFSGVVLGVDRMVHKYPGVRRIRTP